MISNTTNNSDKDEFAQKINLVQNKVKLYNFPTPEIFPSDTLGYRMRVEFRIWHQTDKLYYVMFDSKPPHKPFPVTTFPIASKTIQKLLKRFHKMENVWMKFNYLING